MPDQISPHFRRAEFALMGLFSIRVRVLPVI